MTDEKVVPTASAESDGHTVAPQCDLDDLKRRSVRGGVITFISQGANTAVHLASTIVLARLLSPDDYGMIAMVVAITSFAGLFRDLGLSTASIQKGLLSHAQMSTLFWINVGMGTLLTLMVASAAPLVARFYGVSDLISLTMLLSVSFLFSSFGAQHSALLIREMRFGRQAVANLSGAIISLVVSICLASNDFRYWALAYGTLAGTLTTTLALFMLSPFRPGLPSRRSGIQEMLKFGGNVTGFSVVNYFHRNLDNVLIGRFWGAEALGLYSRAYQLLMMPLLNVRGPLNAVAFPAMSRLQHRPEQFRAYYCRVTSLLALVSMPFTAFLFVSSRSIIELALGRGWSGVAPIFELLAIAGFIHPVASLRGLVLLSTGQGKRYLQWGIFNAICVSIGFLVGIGWGPKGVAASYAVVTYVVLYPSLVMAFQNTSVRYSDFFGSIIVPAFTSLFAVGICVGLDAANWFHSMALPKLLQQLAVFAACFFGMLSILPSGRQEMKRFASLFELLRVRPA